MADRKIQLKNTNQDRLMPVTTVEVIEGIENYAQADHTHTFTGTQGTISVSGSYDKVTGINISNITPTGSISLTRTTNVGVTTSTISYINSAGTLPTVSNATVVTSAINGATATFSGQITSTAYTPKGTVSGGTINTTISLAPNTTSTGGVKYLEEVTISSGALSTTTSYLHYQGASVTGSANFITGVSLNGGTLSVEYLKTTSTNPSVNRQTLQFNFTEPSISTDASKAVTSISSGSLTKNATSSGGIAIMNSASIGTTSLTKTTKYLHPSANAAISGLTFSGTQENISIIPKGTITVSTTAAPTKTISTISTVGTLGTLTSKSVVTGISTQPEFSGTFSGNSVSINSTINTTTTTINSTGVFTPQGTIE